MNNTKHFTLLLIATLQACTERIVNLLTELRPLGQNTLQFFFPISCVSCGSNLPADDYYRICPQCWQNIQLIKDFYCKKCGAYLPYGGEHCYHCLKKPHFHFEFIRSAGVFTGVLKDVIHRFKYNNKDYMSRFLARLLSVTIDIHPELKDVDFIIPVPMHWFKKFRRGYNQTELLAASIANDIRKPLLKKHLLKTKRARPQVGLKREMRLQNVKDCFTFINPQTICKKDVLLIDDVCTTCGTIEECSKVLKKAGARKVYGLTVARD